MTDAVVSSNGVGHDARRRRLLVALLAGGAVSLALGVYAKTHDPTREQPCTLVFSGVLELKVWFATAVVTLAAVQVLLGCFFYGIFTVKVLAVRVPGRWCRAPALRGAAVRKWKFPDVEDQIAFVTDGQGSMPSFGGQLSPAEIRQVVDFTRTL